MGFTVNVVQIDHVENHPNADKLDMVRMKDMDWTCIVGKGQYKVGDKAVYIPIDSILPDDIETKIFDGSKVKLEKHRVKTIKLRGVYSQGLIVSFETLNLSPTWCDLSVGTDLAKILNIKKYEPPTPEFQATSSKQRGPVKCHPHFHKYSGLLNIKDHPRLINGYDQVVVTEKIHGTNFRCGWVPFVADTLWKKIKKFFGKTPKWEFVYGSHNVQLSMELLYRGYYEKNVYAEAVRDYNLKEKLKPGEVIYGEIYGGGIQKGYNYGCNNDERKFVAFDLRLNDEFVSWEDLKELCETRGIPMPPVLFEGLYKDLDREKIVLGKSVLALSQSVREGVVIKTKVEGRGYAGRKILKAISPDYLMKDQTEFH